LIRLPEDLSFELVILLAILEFFSDPITDHNLSDLHPIFVRVIP
jgi:hypothetical protein